MKPVLSVIIPTYHRNDLLALCLQCLRPDVQTIPDMYYEVLVSDDGQEDTAQQLITEQYPWVRWIKGAQRGPAANRNNGATEARGLWLVFTDDDCLPDPNWLATYYQAIQDNPAVNVFEGKTVADRSKYRYDEEAPVNETGGNLWSCNFCICKSVFSQVGGFDEGFPYAAMEDIDLATRLWHLHTSQLFVPKALIVHPLRLIPSTKYDLVFKSYAYFISKHDQVNTQFRLNRFKTLLHSCLVQGKKLATFRFRGWRSFFKEHLFIAKTIFLPSKETPIGNTPLTLSKTTSPLKQ